MNRRLKQLPLSVALSLILVNLAFATRGKPNLNQTEPVHFETRCGWLSNPTPGNIWLDNRDGEWTVAVQGGYQREGVGLAEIQEGTMDRNERRQPRLRLRLFAAAS